MSASLLQDVLRPHAFGPGVNQLGSRLAQASLSSPPSRHDALDDSDDELVGVMSVPGTPSRSNAPSRQPSRPSSPTRMGASKRKAPGPLLMTVKEKERSSDPLKRLPTEVSQRIFSRLSIKDLARCARVSRKWWKSQTLNYVWFQHYRKESLQDEDLPPGKWTRRESKQSWRTIYIQTASQRERESVGSFTAPPRSSRPSSPYTNSLSFSNINAPHSPSLSAMHYSSGGGGGSRGGSLPGSGYATPRELKEEAWKLEAEAKDSPSKIEMREMYKELGGRKAKAKGKFGGAGQTRDKGGWEGGFDEGF